MFKNRQELYKVSASTGKTQVWKAWSLKDEVCSNYGQLGGKMQTNSYKALPKNVGRSNETTATEQAQVELQAMYKDQMDNKHYFLSEIEAIEKAKVCRIPRKVTNFNKRKDKYENKTLYASLKFNGSRGCVVEGEFFSKIGRKEEIKVNHIKEVISKLKYLGYATFDAEVYAHGLPLQRIRSAWLKPVRTDKEIIKVAKDFAKSIGEKFTSKEVTEAVEYLGYNPNEDAPLLKLHIFDIPSDTDRGYLTRQEWMRNMQDSTDFDKITRYVEFEYGVRTENNKEREILLKDAVDNGYEGLVYYEPEGVYEYGKRSTNTMKEKPRLDGEGLVTGVELCKNGEGKLLMKASEALGGVTFKCMMKGSRESRNYEVQQQFIGKWVTFKYEELSKAGIPTKPVAEETRLCDAKGQPLE